MPGAPSTKMRDPGFRENSRRRESSSFRPTKGFGGAGSAPERSGTARVCFREELASRVGERVDELFAGPAADAPPAVSELSLFQEVCERAGHRTGVVAESCGKFPLADPVRGIGRGLVSLDVVENLYREVRY